MGDKIHELKQKAADAAQKGQTRKAIQLFEELLAALPGDTRSLHRLGELWAKEGNQAKAVERFLQAAEGYLEEGFFDRAVAVLRQALTSEPHRPELHARLVDALLAKGQEREAARQLVLLAGEYARAGVDTEQLASLERAAELAPDDAEVSLQLARLQLARGEVAAASARLLAARPALQKTGKLGDLVEPLQALIAAGQAPAELHLLLAEGLLARQAWEPALEALQETLRSRSDDLQALGLSARAYLGAGDLTQASVMAKRLARLARMAGDEAAAQAAKAVLDEVAVRRDEPPPRPR
ncbi:MAG TPA: tetratricopeptide repeat protein [Myxococcota bacterium]|nr:tetratricopeptide repeat protein [Myxococcota bacterium]HRY95489.1 tetratricopeptide repeat protein [Myxococcota bacterium]HSA21739.1 tetratricopeptide repeat protein [Myxococcota bacterium]